MNQIAVVGAGAFGTALAVSLAGEGHTVRLWSRDAALASAMQTTRRNARYLPDVDLPATISPTAQADDLSGCTFYLLCVPAQNTRAFLEVHSASLEAGTLVICAKGVEKSTGLLQSDILAQLSPANPVAVLTGPSFASEIATGKPTALTLASSSLDSAAALQSQLSTSSLRLYASDDIVGAQLGGALKNVAALACGIAIGAGLGESARAALMTRSFSEIMRMALHLGAKSETLRGLSGLGDLALTCTSMLSRNYAAGYALGSGKVMDASKTTEGVATARATADLALAKEIDMPIAQTVAAVLEKSVTIAEAMDALLSRPLKKESH